VVWLEMSENPMLAFPIKKRINTELFIDRRAHNLSSKFSVRQVPLWPSSCIQGQYLITYPAQVRSKSNPVLIVWFTFELPGLCIMSKKSFIIGKDLLSCFLLHWAFTTQKPKDPTYLYPYCCKKIMTTIRYLSLSCGKDNQATQKIQQRMLIVE